MRAGLPRGGRSLSAISDAWCDGRQAPGSPPAVLFLFHRSRTRVSAPHQLLQYKHSVHMRRDGHVVGRELLGRGGALTPERGVASRVSTGGLGGKSRVSARGDRQRAIEAHLLVFWCVKSKPGPPARRETGTLWRAPVRCPRTAEHDRGGGPFGSTSLFPLDEATRVKRCPALGRTSRLKFRSKFAPGWRLSLANSARNVGYQTFGNDELGPLMSFRRSSQILSGISRNTLTIWGSNWRPDQSSISLRAASKDCAGR